MSNNGSFPKIPMNGCFMFEHHGPVEYEVFQRPLALAAKKRCFKHDDFFRIICWQNS